MKRLIVLVMSVFVMLSIATVCYAGDVPEGLLNNDSAQIYFGEIKNVDGKSITVIQRQVIKGAFSKDSEHIHKAFAFTEAPKVGEIYLCGYYDENNPLYVWEVTSLDTKTLRISNTDDMSKRMQEYLNDGKFEEKEKERLSKLGTKQVGNLYSEEPIRANTGESTEKTVNAVAEGNSVLILLLVMVIFLFGIALLLRIKRKK